MDVVVTFVNGFTAADVICDCVEKRFGAGPVGAAEDAAKGLFILALSVGVNPPNGPPLLVEPALKALVVMGRAALDCRRSNLFGMKWL